MLRVAELHRSWPMLLVLVVLPLAIFGPGALRSEFVSLDDTLLITKNATVQELSLRSVARVFTSYDPELYVPLTLLSYQIEHALVGLRPQLFHLTNLLLHTGSVLLVFFLFAAVFKSRAAGFFVALLFAVHPIHTEAVAWAAARKDVLSTFFFLLSLVLYEDSAGESEDASASVRARLLSIGSYLLALLSKVTVVTLPFILLLLDWYRGERITVRRVAEKWPYFLLSAVFAVIAAFGKTRNIASLTVLQYVLISAKSTVFYLNKLFWPVHLSVAYPQSTPVSLQSPEFLAALLLTCALLALTFFMIRVHRGVAFGLLFFFLTLPVNYFNVWKNGYLFFASDRYVYVPSLGIFAAVVALAATIGSGRTRRILLTVIAATSIAVLAALAMVQARTWRNSEALYLQGLSLYPRSSLLLVNLGDVYVRAGKEKEGLQEFEKAIAVDPKNIVALTNAGNLHKKWGDRARAMGLYRQAVNAVPENPFVEQLIGHYLLAEMLLEDGKRDEGFALLTEATRLGSRFAEPFYNLGIMLERYGRGDEAIIAFQDAIARDGSYLAARYHLAALLAERGRLPEAREQLEAIVEAEPGYEKAALHLENIRRLMGE